MFHIFIYFVVFALDVDFFLFLLKFYFFFPTWNEHLLFKIYRFIRLWVFNWILLLMNSVNSLKDLSEGDDDFYSQKHSILTEFFQSLWFALISNTDLICYLFVFINMVVSQSLLALPMPLMVFLWGTLTVPRPSKTFWVSLIAYTEVNNCSFII